MAAARLCPHCGAKLQRFDSDCPACGKATGQRLPFYVYLIGALVVLLLFLAFGDFSAVLRVVLDLGRLLRG